LLDKAREQSICGIFFAEHEAPRAPRGEHEDSERLSFSDLVGKSSSKQQLVSSADWTRGIIKRINGGGGGGNEVNSGASTPDFAYKQSRSISADGIDLLLVMFAGQVVAFVSLPGVLPFTSKQLSLWEGAVSKGGGSSTGSAPTVIVVNAAHHSLATILDTVNKSTGNVFALEESMFLGGNAHAHIVNNKWIETSLKQKQLQPFTEKYEACFPPIMSALAASASASSSSSLSLSLSSSSSSSSSLKRTLSDGEEAGEGGGGGGEGEADTEAEKKRPCIEEEFLPLPSKFVCLNGVEIAAIGIGTLAMGVPYPDPLLKPTPVQVSAMIQEAIAINERVQGEEGSNVRLLFDTADVYSTNGDDVGYMERQLSALVDNSKVVIGTKGGMNRLRGEPGKLSSSWRVKTLSHEISTEGWLKTFRASLTNLNCSVEKPLFMIMVHHVHKTRDQPPDAIFAAAMQAIGLLVAERLVLNVGLCNVTLREIKLCQALGQSQTAPSIPFPIACVQNELSFFHRECEKPFLGEEGISCEKGVLQYCLEQGIIFQPHGIFGGLKARDASHKQHRNLSTAFPLLAAMAKSKGISPHQLCLAYWRHKWPNLLVLVGARRIERIQEIEQVFSVRLTNWEMRQLNGMEK